MGGHARPPSSHPPNKPLPLPSGNGPTTRAPQRKRNVSRGGELIRGRAAMLSVVTGKDWRDIGEGGGV